MTKADEFRKLVKDGYENSFLPMDDYLEELVYNIYEMDDMDLDKTRRVLLSLQQAFIYMIGYTDMYLLMNHKAKELRMKREDYYYKTIMDYIENFDDLKISVSTDQPFFKKLLESIIEYYNLPFLSKMNLAYNIKEEDKQYLSEISVFFKEEQELYTKEVELDDYVKYFIDKINDIQEDYPIYEEQIVVELVGFLKNLSKFNYANYMDNIKDLLTYYYEWVKYDVGHKNNLLEVKGDYKIEFVSYFENLRMEEMVEMISGDDGFLELLLEFYVTTKPNGKVYYQTGEAVSYEEVKEYIKKRD